jgi:hypothetical protein
MARAHYWAVRPIRYPDQVRIERAYTAQGACLVAFGRGIAKDTWEGKDLGTRAESESVTRGKIIDSRGWFKIEERANVVAN